MRFAARGGDGQRFDVDVRDVVEPDVALQKFDVARQRLEGVDTARVAGELRREQREEANVRADVEDRRARPDALAKKLLHGAFVRAEPASIRARSGDPPPAA